MGVVNVTPDSFSDGGRFAEGGMALVHAEGLVPAGADIVDVGGESSRPGAQPVSADVECARVLPLCRALRGRCTVSVDTCKAEVADAALSAGAEIVNDVSGGLFDPDLLRVAARREAAVVLGHLRGRPENMQAHAEYQDVVREVCEELRERVARAVESGVPRGRVLVDPGLGFAKRAEHNLALLRRLGEVCALGHPVVVGASRKSFLGEITAKAVDGREVATAGANAIAVANGAQVVRVHDVASQIDAVRVADAVRRAQGAP